VSLRIRLAWAPVGPRYVVAREWHFEWRYRIEFDPSAPLLTPGPHPYSCLRLQLSNRVAIV
jgi:hypothetical protein